MMVGGCGRKLSMQVLGGMLASGHGDGIPPAFTDVVWHSPQAGQLATTCDLLYDFGCGPSALGYVSVVHAASDAYAALASPGMATITLGVTRELADAGASSVVDGYMQALSDLSITFGGGHSVYADTSFVGVTIVGSRDASPSFAFDSSHRYVVLLSKPVGVGMGLAALRHGVAPDSDVDQMVSLMRRSNERDGVAVAACLAEADSAVAFCTDVSGFGLGGAIRQVLPTAADCVIDLELVPALDVCESAIQHGLTSSLGDRNLVWLLDDVRSEVELTPDSIVLAADPQTSGGLVVGVREDLADKLLSDEDSSWTRIGDMKASRDPQSRLVLATGL